MSVAPSTLDVYLDGALVGALEQTPSGNTTFRYDDEHRARPDATPLSLSMPVSRSLHARRAVVPFLQGLLPDSPGRLDELSREFHTTATNPFRLLAHVGRDVAGAVQILPPGEPASDVGSRADIDPLSDADVAEIIRDLVANADTWGTRGSSGRWSLPGAQPKVALFRGPDGAWGVPRGATPTTHILKPAVPPYVEHHVNEYVTMTAARQLGLHVADAGLLTTARGDQVFVTERYDRVVRDGRWRRLHQEDFCQALSVAPTRKYQSDGGPSVAQMARLIDTFAHLDRRRRSQRRLFDALVFNVSVANTDAHAKNYSILLNAETAELAPLYDLGTQLAYESTRPRASAMKIGDEYRLDKIGMAQLLGVARQLRIPIDEAEGRVHEIRSGLAEAVAVAAAGIPGKSERAIAERIADAVAVHTRSLGW
jgi:serine/threonine-protein kinase HipA